MTRPLPKYMAVKSSILVSCTILFVCGAASSSPLEIITRLQQADSESRLKAIEDVRQLKDPLPREAAVILAEYLKDPDTRVLLGALELLERMGPDASIAVFALVDLLKGDPIRYVYSSFEGIGLDIHGPALRVLASIGPAAKDAVPTVLDVFNKHKAPKDASDVGRRDLALEVLAKIGPNAADAVPVLIDYIKDTSPLEQWFHSSPSLKAMPFIPVFRVFQSLGPSANAALPALKQYTELSHSGAVRYEALKAIVAIDPRSPDLYPIALRSLSRVTRPSDKEDFELALELVRKQSSLSRKEIEMTVEFLHHITEERKGNVFTNELVNDVLCDVFVRHKDLAGGAVPVLAKIVEYYPSQGAVSGLPKILETLGALGPQADAAVPAIKKKVLDPWFAIEGYREAGVEALKQINTPAARAALEEYEVKKKTNFW